MKRAMIVLTLLAGGCASYSQAKIELTTQVRRGIESTRQATIAKQHVIDRLSDAQLDRLDVAFDADVRDRRTLTADWVIAHRKAYTIARDAMSEQKQSLRAGQLTIEANLDAIGAALDQLQQMHQIEAKWNLPEVIK